jgi:hypothetical protein
VLLKIRQGVLGFMQRQNSRQIRTQKIMLNRMWHKGDKMKVEDVKSNEVITEVKPETKLSNHYYIFTSWGLVRGTVVKERIDKYTGVKQYKFIIDIDKSNKGKDYDFWYTEDQMYNYKYKAILSAI